METFAFEIPEEEELEDFKMYMHNVKACHLAVASAKDYAERDMWKNSLVNANLEHNEELERVFRTYADMEKIGNRLVVGAYIDTMTHRLIVKVEEEKDGLNTGQTV